MSPCLASLSFVTFNWFPCLIGCSVHSSGRLLITHSIVSLAPLLHFHVLGSIPAFLGATVAFSGFMGFLIERVERMRGLHNSSPHGDCLRPVAVCPTSRPIMVLIPPWSQAGRRGRDTKQKVHESQTQTQHHHQQVKEILLSDKSCFINLLCEIFDGVSIGNVFHHPRQRCHRNRHH